MCFLKRHPNLLLSGLLLLAVSLTITWLEFIRRAPDARANLRIFDREGRVLVSEANEHFGRRIWVPLGSISPNLISAVLEQEDRRFYQHPGLDPKAIARAVQANFSSGELSQGASTITQQLAKILLENWRGKRVGRNFFWKGVEALLALDCEWHWSKQEILERYLNNVYFGHRLYGVEAASQVYFAKSARDLTAAESHALASHLKRPNQARALLADPFAETLAPHLLAMLSGEAPRSGQGDASIRSTLDHRLQAVAERALQRGIEKLKISDEQIQGAAVVIDVSSGELRALVGSADFQDRARGGQVNHATALRQPGSTLKPFTYMMAFLHQQGPANLVLDAPFHFYTKDGASYIPQNFDRRHHGVLSIREALANSYNIPAVLTLEELGLPYYLDFLRAFGFRSLKEGPDHYGLSLTLGSGAVSLLELTNAYAALARGGRYQDLRIVSPPEHLAKPSGAAKAPSDPAVEKAAFLVTSILSDPEARRRAFGDAALMTVEGQNAVVKTGTSHDSRDGWAVGYTPRYAVGIWTGHSDNSPMPGLTGAVAAIPIWNEIMSELHRGQAALEFKAPAGLALRAFCSDPLCQVVKNDWTSAQRKHDPRVPEPEESFRFIRPADGDHFLLDAKRPRDRQLISVEVRLPGKLYESAQAHGEPIRWLVDGVLAATTRYDQPKTFLRLSPGRHRVEAWVGEKKARLARVTVSEEAR